MIRNPQLEGRRLKEKLKLNKDELSAYEQQFKALVDNDEYRILGAHLEIRPKRRHK